MLDQDYEFGPSDYFQLSVWYLALILLVKWQGWLLGIALYACLLQVVAFVLKKTLSLEMMSGGDEVFFSDDHRNKSNIIAYKKYQKFETEKMRKVLLQRGVAFRRIRSSIVKVMGKYMFKDMGVEYTLKEGSKNLIAKSGIHTEQELADFMCAEQMVREPLGGLQWKVWLIEDYTETESVFVWKVHHSLADGIALILFFSNLCDNPKLEDLPPITTRFTMLQYVGQLLIVPVYMLALGAKMLFFTADENNGLKTPEIKAALRDHKQAAFCPSISTDLIKSRSKELKCTFNDILMTCVSRSLKQYLEQTGDKSTHKINLACPFSLRPTPKTVDGFELDNNFAILLMALNLVDDVSDGLERIKRDMLSLKHSLQPIGYFYLLKVTMQLPEFLRAYLLEKLSEKTSIGFSNVPGPRNPWVVDGKEVDTLGFFMPVMKTVTASISICSHAQTVKIGVLADRATMRHPEDLIKLIKTNLDQMLGKQWREFDPKNADQRSSPSLASAETQCES